MAGFRQLAAFEAVATELHFGRAADRLEISQAAVSQLIHRLEREHGVVLFQRSSRQVSLTASGAALLEPARRVLHAHAAFVEAASAAAEGSRGTLRIAPTEATAGPLAFLLDGFRREHPSIAVELVTVESAAKPAAVREGTVDLAFVRSPTQAAGVRSEPLWSEPFVAVLPASRVTPGSTEIDPEALSQLPLMIIDRAAHPAMHDALIAEARRAGVEPKLGRPLMGGREGLAAVAAADAWTLVPASNAPDELPQLASRSFPAPEPETTISLLLRVTGASATAMAFVEHARRVTRTGQLALRGLFNSAIDHLLSDRSMSCAGLNQSPILRHGAH